MAGKGLAFWRIWVQPSGASPAWSGRWPCGRGLVLSGVGLQPEPHATNPSPLLLWDLQKLEDQEQRARQLKERLRSKQQSLQQQLEQLRGLAGAAERERLRTDSLDSSGLSSERSDSDQGECPEAEGLCGPWGKPGLLIGPLPAQRSWRWMWRAWCLAVRPSCCGASSPARSTATRTVAAPGYDVPHPGVASLPSARARPTCQAGALPKPLGLLGVTCWNGLKGPLCGNRCSPNTLLLAARQALWKGKGQDSSGPPWTPAGQAAWA